ncbi:MAG: hypothetical protein ACOZQL_10645 [Myxococcota bacterium]
MIGRISAVAVLLVSSLSLAGECPTEAELQASELEAASVRQPGSLPPAEYSKRVKEVLDRRAALLSRRDACARAAEESRQQQEQQLAAASSAEAKRQADAERAERARKRDAAIETMKQPTMMQGALSTLICDEKDLENEALAQIREERENAKIAGVVSVAKLKVLQDEVVKSRKIQQGYAKALGETAKRKPLGCETAVVRLIRFCRENDDAKCAPVSAVVDFGIDELNYRRHAE